MGLFDDYTDPQQFQGSGGVLGPMFSWPQQLDPSQSGAGAQNLPSDNSLAAASANADGSQAASPGIAARLGAGLQSWAQTPVGSPFAALANGINAFNAAQPASAADGSFIGPPAPASTAAPDLGARLGAAFQSWAQTPVGSPFAALANSINGFNTGQTSVANAATAAQKPVATQDSDDRANTVVQSPANPPVANVALAKPVRRLVVIRRGPQ